MADATVAAITAMGFSEDMAQRSIRHAGLDPERAIEWILNCGDAFNECSEDETDEDAYHQNLSSRVETDVSPMDALQRLEAINAAWEADIACDQESASRVVPSPEHPDLHVLHSHNVLLEGAPLRVAGKPDEPRGRWFEVLEASPAGSDLLIEPAYVVAPVQFTSSTCCHCLRVRGAEEHITASAQYHCQLCNADETSFCSERCEARWSARHELECPLIEPLLGMLFDMPGVAMYNALLVLRLMVEHALLVQQSNVQEVGDPDGLEVALGRNPVGASIEDCGWDLCSARWSAVQVLQSHRQTLSTRRPTYYKQLVELSDSMVELMPASLRGVDLAGHSGGNPGILKRNHPDAGVTAPLDRRIRRSVGLDKNTLRDLLCAVQINSFAVKLPDRAQGAALAPGCCPHLFTERCLNDGAVIAMANHSCDPNCEVVVVRGGQQGEPELTFALRALRDLAAGDEATIDYLSTSSTCSEPGAAGGRGAGRRRDAHESGRAYCLLPVAKRRKLLWETKFFLCECSKCVEEGSIEVPAAATAATGGSDKCSSSAGSTLLRPFSAAWYECSPNKMWLSCKEIDANWCPPVTSCGQLNGTCRYQKHLSMALHLQAGVGENMIDMISTKMTIIPRLFEFDQLDHLELEPEPEPEPGLRGAKAGARASLLVGHVVGVLTPEPHRRKGHATLALRECITQLRSKGYDLVTLDCHRDVSPLYAKAGFAQVNDPGHSAIPFWLCGVRELRDSNMMDMVYVLSNHGAELVAEHTACSVNAAERRQSGNAISTEM